VVITQRQPQDERVASAVEYGLIVSLIAAVVVTAVLGLGVLTGSLMSKPCERVETSGATTAQC